MGAQVIAISADPEGQAQEVADTVSFPIAHSVSRKITDSIDSWWDENRGFVQPSEFILNQDNIVVFSSYSAGPAGRLAAEDTIKMIGYIESQK